MQIKCCSKHRGASDLVAAVVAAGLRQRMQIGNRVAVWFRVGIRTRGVPTLPFTAPTAIARDGPRQNAAVASGAELGGSIRIAPL